MSGLPETSVSSVARQFSDSAQPPSPWKSGGVRSRNGGMIPLSQTGAPFNKSGICKVIALTLTAPPSFHPLMLLDPEFPISCEPKSFLPLGNGFVRWNFADQSRGSGSSLGVSEGVPISPLQMNKFPRLSQTKRRASIINN